MRSPEGRDFWTTGVYREIVPLEQIVYTDSFSDKEGNVVPATHYGKSADFPLETLVIVTFEDYGRKTKMTLKPIDLPVGEMSEQTGAGWNESFAFSRGAAFEDKYGLLEGVGKVSKNVWFRDVTDINEDALRYCIEQALEFDSK